MLGEDKKQIVRDMVLVTKIPDSGCEEMPSVYASSLTKSYVKLAKKGLVPIGVIRIGKSISEGGHWHGCSGNAIYTSIGCVVTVAQGIFKAEVFIPHVRKKQRDKYDYGFFNGRIKELSVLLTDK